MTLEFLWIYIAVPAALISVLVFIRLSQEKKAGKSSRISRTEDKKEEIRASERDLAENNFDRSGMIKPENCPQFLGYLYLRKAEGGNDILSECYNCPKLLQCLYTPNVMEKVYG